MIRKALQNPYIVAVLAVVGLVALGLQLRKVLPDPAGGSSGSPSPAAKVQPSQTKSSVSNGEPPIDTSQIEWDLDLERNPFQPAKALLETAGVQSVEKVQELVPKLSAVWIQEGSRCAILNGRVAGEGDAVLQWRVKAIHPDRVVVEGPRGELTVRFGGKVK